MNVFKKNHKGKAGLFLLSFLLIFSVIAVQGFSGEAKGKGYLGVNIEKMTGDDRDEFGVQFGVLVTSIVKDEAAFKAGLKKYDVIQFVGDVKTRRPDDVVEAVSSRKPGSKVKIKFVRDGKAGVVTAVLGERKKDVFYFKKGGDEFAILGDKLHGKLKELKELKKLKEFKMPKTWTMKKTAFLGVEMQSMDENFSKYFGVKKDGGALVMKVTRDSAAEKAGLLSGDVILKLDGKAVTGPADVSKFIRSKKKGDKVKITLFRHKKVRKVTAELDERSKSGAMFFGDHFNIDVPKMMKKVKVWVDEDGEVHKEMYNIKKEKEMLLKEKQKQKEEIKKLKKLKEKELQEKLKVLKEEEEKEEEVFI